MAHSTHDTLINRFLDARGLLLETRSVLAGFAEGQGGEIATDPRALSDLYREVDSYLASVGASRTDAGARS
jgi:hypothetical protein